MLLVPAPARNFLDPADFRRDWTTYGSMLIRRQVAMRTLLPAYTDLGRLGTGALAWLAGLVGATVLRAGAGDETALGLTGTAAAVVGGLLLVLGVGVGIAVAVVGSKLSRGLALWALLPLLIRADGARRVPGSVPTAPPARGSDDPAVSLAPRLVAAVVAAGVAVVWTVDVVRDGIDVLAPYSTTADLGVLLASVLGAGVSWTAAATSWRGWRRVRAALSGRAAPSQEAAALRELHGSAETDRAPAVPAEAAAYAGPATPEPPTDADPRLPAAPVAPRPHRSEVVQVRLGGRLLEPGTTLVGRAPAARAGERIDRTLAVEDPTMSKTHLTVRVTPAGVWVTDRASTNGTTVVTAHGERRLAAWEETKVPPGARVRAGATVLAVAADETDPEIESTVLRGAP
ncbi:FHA domain-containing protein [Georgenia sp. EYE_87]|uniref:FHA domain-containing protein n=1 Tax=Georgenia sp. EYE_87 TaxID=2853448 RepID=UPI002004BE5F|nr:FHA domain-containing protein [Georgenia sp. EYE_87]MCK6209428.1 FHA domain-containing protein [Georgenia sp. EYE_87]